MIVFLYITGISLAMFLSTYLMFQIVSAFRDNPNKPVEMKFARLAFLRRNGWQLLSSFIVICVAMAVSRFPATEAVGLGGLIMCGTITCTLLYDPINRLGTRLELWSSVLGAKARKQKQA